jgi:DNA-binding NarL/FixJ family response regulator
MNRPITVFLVDDHEIVRAGLRAVLDANADIEVVGEAGTAELAEARIPVVAPDVALLDINLPDRTGIELCRRLREICPDVHSVMLTSYDEDEALFGAVLAGAAGYVLKHVGADHLAECVRRASVGDTCADHVAAQHVRERAAHATDPSLSGLTDQERRVLALLAEGLTNREIGERLYLADTTVKNYVSSLLMKLGMSRRSEAAALAARLDERRRAFLEPVADTPATRF